MCRLSIIIPLCADDELFEDTLVSVLQHRPSDCEVVVVHSQDYADPYELQGEVRFVRTASRASSVCMVNAGCGVAEGEILHVLEPGILASDGWTEDVLNSFEDLQVGAVAPLVVSAADPELVVAAGVRYTRGGRRLLHGAGRRVRESRRLFQRPILGPPLFAGFYRRWIWNAMGGFCEQLDSDWAAADFALSVRAFGYRSLLEPACVVRSLLANVGEAGSFRSGRNAERVFWRHAAAQGWVSSLALHPWTVLGGALQGWKSPGTYLQLLGRAAGLLGLPKHLVQAARIRQAFELFLLEHPPAGAAHRVAHPADTLTDSRSSGYRDAA